MAAFANALQVEELKQSESTELVQMNQVYLEKKFSVKKLND